MICLGLDDTDTLDSPGTNQLAKVIVRALSREWKCLRITRHQLLDDPRVPYTSQNGSASIVLQPRGDGDGDVEAVWETAVDVIGQLAPTGSDPGLCLRTSSSLRDEVVAFGVRCQQELVTQDEARSLAARCGLRLIGLGGTEGGVIGAVAAIGLAAAGRDGRVVQLGEHPDNMSGWQPVWRLRERDVCVRDLTDDAEVSSGFVDLGKKLRPNVRGGRVVLFVERSPDLPTAAWVARKLL